MLFGAVCGGISGGAGQLGGLGKEAVLKFTQEAAEKNP